MLYRSDWPPQGISCAAVVWALHRDGWRAQSRRSRNDLWPRSRLGVADSCQHFHRLLSGRAWHLALGRTQYWQVSAFPPMAYCFCRSCRSLQPGLGSGDGPAIQVHRPQQLARDFHAARLSSGCRDSSPLSKIPRHSEPCFADCPAIDRPRCLVLCRVQVSNWRGACLPRARRSCFVDPRTGIRGGAANSRE